MSSATSTSSPTTVAPNDGRTVLALSNVTKTYPGTPPVHAIRGVDLDIQSGELVAIVGPSGSGKSTLLHVVGTLDRATSGTVSVAGYDVYDITEKQLS